MNKDPTGRARPRKRQPNQPAKRTLAKKRAQIKHFTAPLRHRMTCRVLFEEIAPGLWDRPDLLAWPPDVFGLCAYALQASGTYRLVLADWPVECHGFKESGQKWHDWTKQIAGEWRDQYQQAPFAPAPVLKLWARLYTLLDAPLTMPPTRRGWKEVQEQTQAVQTMLCLLALADSASAGMGIPDKEDMEEIVFEGNVLLTHPYMTLSRVIYPDRARVLPKLKTPQTGITLRSLSHHLALHIGSDVTPKWHFLPQFTSPERMNILLAPWPLQVGPQHFKASGLEIAHYGTMAFDMPSKAHEVATWTKRILERAQEAVGTVHALVFPESSLTEQEFDAVMRAQGKDSRLVVAGVRGANGGSHQNTLRVESASDGSRTGGFTQAKHHRWKLDRPQIERYGLAPTLRPQVPWWEGIDIPPRELHFAAVDNGTALCFLICEDLARSDPVSPLVRAVGPNLLIALLQDGPQLAHRWSARYSTVLADDPGCSVLSLTSLGMAMLSRAPAGAKPSRSIALWQDAKPKYEEVDLPDWADAAVVTICSDQKKEWTADERSDEGVTDHLRLAAVHYIASGTGPKHGL